ncbi:carbohydrate ABC transporter substrate-binding protein (CUT1 family) [Kineothrix alysoides]|uniref:Carbohydrate ABC transporter substrate-binding protein (CUT1 family) n=1 Tax=Kineothrix alysoides TaxID=1469948 RepID=A0A4R1QUH8_9FIRM|nr:extracellular solute-binding protein [Kineothrix alysoides]TCL57578.1 carbohydrate ABC transporter substrate-binding protein (CUT1 family) [Kineothrix alysoides]
MRKKKIISILLAITLTAGLMVSGCGKASDTAASNKTTEKAATESAADSSGTAATETESAADTVEAAKKIVVFQSKVEIMDQLEALCEEYGKETGVEVEVWGTTGDDYVQQLKIKLSNNQGPTVFSLAPGSESDDLISYLADLGDLSFVKDIAANMADEKDGKVVGIPYTVEGFGVVYNKDLINPAEITTTDAFIQMLKDQKAAGINGFSLSQESYFLIGHILNTPFALQSDPGAFVQQVVNGEVKLQDSEDFQEFARLMEAVRDNTNNPLEITYDRETGDFATGKSASIHQGNWCYGMFADYDVNFDMGIMPLPISGNDKLAVSVPACWYVNSQASEAEQLAGKQFLEWVYTSEIGQKYLIDEFGFIPVLTTMESVSADPLSQSVAEYTAEGKTIGWPMNTYWPAGIVDVNLVPVAEKFFTTDMTGEEFLAELNEAFVTAGK